MIFRRLLKIGQSRHVTWNLSYDCAVRNQHRVSGRRGSPCLREEETREASSYSWAWSSGTKDA